MDLPFFGQRYATTYHVLGTLLALFSSLFLMKLYLVRSKTLRLQKLGLVSGINLADTVSRIISL